MAFLAMSRGVDTARERLMELFWPEVEPDRARDSLGVALWSIRRCLKTAGFDPDEFLVTTKSIVRWRGDTDVDATRFAKLAQQADAASSEEALKLYRGDFLEGDFDNWTVTERERLAALYETVLARVIESSKDATLAQRLISRNPYDENAYIPLIEAELAAGRRSSAVSWVERCRKAMAELGETPSTTFEQRFGNIVRLTPLVPEELTLPFAGRDTELTLLAARLSDAAGGNGSLTFVLGEAGIGKSTLLEREAVQARSSGLRVLVVRCEPEAQETFGPWRRLFADLGAGDFDTLAGAPSDLAACVAVAIARYIAGPAVLIVDDVHELTGEAFDIFAALAREVAREHAVIASARPEGAARIRSRLTDLHYREMLLERLTQTDLKSALAQVLGGDQAELSDVLYQRTGGHPLFFVGLLNSLVDRGILAHEDGRWVLAKAPGADLNLPETVRRFIEARLQARGETARAVAAVLALEPSASAKDLASVLGLDEPTTLDALDDLLGLGLITQPTSGTQFAFVHDLIREVAAAGVNAGRRASMHRALAERLDASDQLDTSLRLARHLELAGEQLKAAQAYLKSAQEALELNAPQDALDRCEAGIKAAESLERSPARDVALAALHRVAARAALVSSNFDEALMRACNSVQYARTGEDRRESTLSLLDLSAMQGVAFHIHEQRSDAIAARESARLCGDQQLEAQSFIQEAAAARRVGMRDEALSASRAAYQLAVKHGRFDIAVLGLRELLLAQNTWWLFREALETSQLGQDAARRSDALLEASFLHAQATLWYLMSLYSHATAALHGALRLAEEISRRPSLLSDAPAPPQPYLQFACYHMAAKVAVAQAQWTEALDAADRASSLTSATKLPHHREALSLVRIDARLRRNLPGDSEIARDLSETLGESTRTQDVMVWSDCVELARARVAARFRLPDALDQLRFAIDVLEENAHRAHLDCDFAFSRLFEAASEFGETTIAARALARSQYYGRGRATISERLAIGAHR